jgi:hypothetical protein
MYVYIFLLTSCKANYFFREMGFGFTLHTPDRAFQVKIKHVSECLRKTLSTMKSRQQKDQYFSFLLLMFVLCKWLAC